MASRIAQREVKKNAKSEDVGRKLADSMADGNVDVSMRDELVDISTVEKGERESGHRSWMFRFTRAIANWYAMQFGIIYSVLCD